MLYRRRPEVDNFLTVVRIASKAAGSRLRAAWTARVFLTRVITSSAVSSYAILKRV